MEHPINKKETEEFNKLLRAIPAEEREKLLSVLRGLAADAGETARKQSIFRMLASIHDEKALKRIYQVVYVWFLREP